MQAEKELHFNGKRAFYDFEHLESPRESDTTCLSEVTANLSTDKKKLQDSILTIFASCHS